MATFASLPTELLIAIFGQVEICHALHVFLSDRATHDAAKDAMYGNLVFKAHKIRNIPNPALNHGLRSALGRTKRICAFEDTIVAGTLTEDVHNNNDSRILSRITHFTPNLEELELESASDTVIVDLPNLPKLRKLIITGNCTDLMLQIQQYHAIEHLEMEANDIQCMNLPQLFDTLTTLKLRGPNCVTWMRPINGIHNPSLPLPFKHLRAITIEGLYRRFQSPMLSLASRLQRSRNTLEELTIIERSGRFGPPSQEDGDFTSFTKLRKIKILVDFENIYPWFQLEQKMIGITSHTVQEYELELPLIPIHRLRKTTRSVADLVTYIRAPHRLSALSKVTISVSRSVMKTLREGKQQQLTLEELTESKRWKGYKSPTIHNTIFAMQKFLAFCQGLEAAGTHNVQVDATQIADVIKEEIAHIQKADIVNFEQFRSP